MIPHASKPSDAPREESVRCAAMMVKALNHNGTLYVLTRKAAETAKIRIRAHSAYAIYDTPTSMIVQQKLAVPGGGLVVAEDSCSWKRIPIRTRLEVEDHVREGPQDCG